MDIKSNVFESFLVSQLKKQNREMKAELLERDRLVEQVKRDMKLSRITELEIEL